MLLILYLKTTQDFDKEDEEVLQCCAGVTMCIFAIFSDWRKKWPDTESPDDMHRFNV